VAYQRAWRAFHDLPRPTQAPTGSPVAHKHCSDPPESPQRTSIASFPAERKFRRSPPGRWDPAEARETPWGQSVVLPVPCRAGRPGVKPDSAIYPGQLVAEPDGCMTVWPPAQNVMHPSRIDFCTCEAEIGKLIMGARLVCQMKGVRDWSPSARLAGCPARYSPVIPST
jgi:hypothetical protein